MEGYLYDVIENTGNRDMIVRIGHKKFTNLTLLPPHKGTEY